MPSIIIPKLNKEIVVEQNANLMKSLLDADLPVASSCDGEGVCAKCKIKVLSGNEKLKSPNEVEAFLIESNNISKEFRISCQVSVCNDISVDATYW